MINSVSLLFNILPYQNLRIRIDTFLTDKFNFSSFIKIRLILQIEIVKFYMFFFKNKLNALLLLEFLLQNIH